MNSFVDWLGPSLAAVLFLTLGGLKLLGLRCGIQGGRGTSIFHHACGSCPAWRSRTARLVVPLVLLVVGFVNVGLVLRFFWK
jgi:hypothetical protein